METPRKQEHAHHNKKEGAVAVVTGGAGGIGTAICRALAREGMHVVVGYNKSVDAARALVESLPGEGHAALSAPVTDGAALSVFARTVGARYGLCDVLINCPGTTRFVPHDDSNPLDDTLLESILSTNVRGPFATIRALRPLLNKSKQPG